MERRDCSETTKNPHTALKADSRTYRRQTGVSKEEGPVELCLEDPRERRFLTDRRGICRRWRAALQRRGTRTLDEQVQGIWCSETGHSTARSTDLHIISIAPLFRMCLRCPYSTFLRHPVRRRRWCHRAGSALPRRPPSRSPRGGGP